MHVEARKSHAKIAQQRGAEAVREREYCVVRDLDIRPGEIARIAEIERNRNAGHIAEAECGRSLGSRILPGKTSENGVMGPNRIVDPGITLVILLSQNWICELIADQPGLSGQRICLN